MLQAEVAQWHVMLNAVSFLGAAPFLSAVSFLVILSAAKNLSCMEMSFLG